MARYIKQEMILLKKVLCYHNGAKDFSFFFVYKNFCKAK